MCISPETVIAKEYMLRHFGDCFSSLKGSRIALYPGECLEDIVREYDGEYHFQCVLEPGSTEVPSDIDVVIMTNFRGVNETDYNCIHESCDRQGIRLMDLFGIDQIMLHRELEEQKYLTITQWKELLSDYEVVSLSIPWAAADYNEQQDRWVIRRRFLLLFRWMQDNGKTVVFFAENDEQVHALESEQIDVRRNLIRRKGKTRGYLQLVEKYTEKKIIHIGTDVVVDGIVPREYGIDSRLIRYYEFTDEVSVSGKDNVFCTDRNRLFEEIDRHDIISFDIFDTLLKRIVLYPKDVFEIVQERTGIEGFADHRYEIQTTRPHLSLDGIYSCLKEQCGYDDETTEVLRQAELETEMNVIMPRSSMIKVFEYAKNQGKTVALISDMYLDPDDIRGLLEKNGIKGYSAMYISCSYGKLKQEGLFEELSEWRKNGETVLHVGDNYYSDVAVAEEFGLDAFYVPSCLDMAVKNGYAEAAAMCRSLADRKLMGLGIAQGFDDPFGKNADEGIAAMIIAPLAVGYLQWVCAALAGKEYDWFLLSARDGWILVDAYNRLRKKLPFSIPPGKYYYTSRHAAFMTVIDDPEVVAGFGYMPKNENHLHRIFVLPYEKILPYDGESAEDYYHLHEQVIHETAERFRGHYREYLEKEDILGRKCAVMDFVSEGSSQQMLEKNITGVIDGYYFGVPEYVSRYSPNIRYFLDNDLMDYNTEMKIEVYFTSEEPALDHIGVNGEPVFAAEVRDEKTLERIHFIHEKVKTCLNQYLDHLYNSTDVFDKDMIFALCKTVNDYKTCNFYYDDMSGQEIETEI